MSTSQFALETPKPTIFHSAYYNLMRVAGLLGLASIVDSLKIWRSFLADIITHYQEWIRLPIYKAFMVVWPDWLFALPRMGIDLLIVWCAFFAAASYHVYYEDGRNIFSHIYANETDLRSSKAVVLLRTIGKVITIFIVGPVLYPLKAISQYRSGGRRDQLIITPWLVMKPRAIIKYVFYQLLALVVLLFINWQWLPKEGL